MVVVSRICLAAAISGGVLAQQSHEHGPLVKFEEIKRLPSKWQSQGKAEDDTFIKVQIGLKQSNIEGLQQKLLDISNPDSPNYGKWLSHEEIAAYTAPHPRHVTAVQSWLTKAGITDHTQPFVDWIEFHAPISKLEPLLNASYEWFTHVQTGVTVPRTKEFSVPHNLHSYIDIITPTTTFYSKIKPRMLLSETHAEPLADTTPDFIKKAYNVTYKSSGTQLVVTTGFLGVGASHADYKAFGNKFVPNLKDFKDVAVNNGSNSDNGSEVEGNLDTQYLGGISHPNPGVFLAFGRVGKDTNSFNDAMLDFAGYLNNKNTVPLPSVASTSYGSEERYVPTNYLVRVCNELMKAGCRGISVFFSSGDNGVGGIGEKRCNEGYYATWPASCPWITSVGGTEFDSSGREVVANFSQYTDGRSQSPGGGYSEHFKALNYTRPLTVNYARSLPSEMQKMFKIHNRGYPDISLVSVNFPVNVGKSFTHTLGTSASCPSVAGLVSLLNDYRHQHNKPRLGFLNPLLYSKKVRNYAIRDVVSGSNPGCNSHGFPAATGWDAATGLGSFDFSKLLEIVKTLK